MTQRGVRDYPAGRNEVYVQALPPETSRWLVSSNGGAQPMWRGDGKEPFFIADSEVMAAAVKTSPRFSSEAAVPLFRVNVDGADASVRNQFAVTPDGQRFLVSAIEEDVAPILSFMKTILRCSLAAVHVRSLFPVIQ